MSKNTDTVQTVGSANCSFWGLLTIVFITLKLCGVIHWSWWLVCLPMIICMGLGVTLLAIAGICWGIAVWLRSRK